MRVGLYLHVPFCVRKCAYCDFYSLPLTEELADAYTEALLRAMRTQPYGTLRADTLYLGGGTPTLLGARRLSRLLEAANECFHLPPDAELTVEANPGTVDAALLRDLRAAGCNRVSLGAQSLNDRELRALGRMHTADEAVEAVTLAHMAGFARVSADLMLGIPGQTPESLARSINQLTALPVDHISAYLLKLEAGTPFGDREPNGLPDEDTVEALYLGCVERLETAGIAQYEISNFAHPGGESRHNLKYWRCEEYLGLGPAAHSYVNGRRFAFPRDLNAFLAAPEPCALAEADGPGGMLDEQIMLRLRLAEGLDTGLLRQRGLDPAPLLQAATNLARHGLCNLTDGRVALTPRGFLLSNPVTATLLAALGL